MKTLALCLPVLALLAAASCGGDGDGEVASGGESGMAGKGSTSGGAGAAATAGGSSAGSSHSAGTGSPSAGEGGTAGSTLGAAGAMSAGDGGAAAGGAPANDRCGGCNYSGPAPQICIYQAGGPGPGRFVCATQNPCGAAGACACIVAQGTCNFMLEGGSPSYCVCDNGID